MKCLKYRTLLIVYATFSVMKPWWLILHQRSAPGSSSTWVWELFDALYEITVCKNNKVDQFWKWITRSDEDMIFLSMFSLDQFSCFIYVETHLLLVKMLESSCNSNWTKSTIIISKWSSVCVKLSVQVVVGIHRNRTTMELLFGLVWLHSPVAWWLYWLLIIRAWLDRYYCIKA